MLTSSMATTFYDRIEKALSNKSNEQKLFRYISNYRDKHADILSSPIVNKILIFTDKDWNIIWDILDIEEKEVKQVVKNMKGKPGINAVDRKGNVKSTTVPQNITPWRCIMCLIMRYYVLHKNPEKLALIYMYFAYSLQFTLIQSQFGRTNGQINANIMQYTIENLSNKFLIRKGGSLERAIQISTSGAVDNQIKNNRFVECSNDDINYIIMDIKTRFRNFISHLAQEYNKNYDEGNLIFSQSEFAQDDSGNVMHLASKTDTIEGLSNEYATKFFSNPPSDKIVSMCSQLCKISRNELKSTINLLNHSDRGNEVKEFYSALFFTFFKLKPNATMDDIKSTSFISVCDSIYKKGNSNDKSIIAIKNLSHKWLQSGSSVYKATKRIPTQNDYRKAIFMYFVLAVAFNK